MGKGIAVRFKQVFGGLAELRNQGKKTGEVAFLKSGSRDIYYLITKAKYFQKPSYESLQASLVDLKNLMLTRGQTRLAMPRIGSGLDGLAWERVREMIKTVFSNSGVEILVCLHSGS